MAVGGDTYYTRIIDERFPDFDSVIPKDNEKELVVNRKNLLSAVRRVSIFSNRSTHQIALVLTKEKRSQKPSCLSRVPIGQRKMVLESRELSIVATLAKVL